ncbi:MAG: hypothetical protein M3315_10725, partial [Actinomycetota bacterium]|nr:hypothetical protein [Actinomycetota bacterium]
TQRPARRRAGSPRKPSTPSDPEPNNTSERHHYGHNRLFEAARGTYAEAKEAFEAGETASKEAGRATQTRETMQEARGKLEEAREPLSHVLDFNLDPELKEYAGLLSEALDT